MCGSFLVKWWTTSLVHHVNLIISPIAALFLKKKREKAFPPIHIYSISQFPHLSLKPVNFLLYI